MFIIFIALLLAFLPVSEPKKNVLLIIVDDLRPALGCYKDENAFTPNIDKLAKNSMQFNNAFAQQALCAPSRNSLLTSRRPDSLYLYDFYSYWRLAAGNFTTLPQHFKQHGYTTASFGKVFHPGASSNWTDDSPYSWSLPPFHPHTQDYKDSPVCIDHTTGHAHSNLVCPVETSLQPGGTLPDIEILEAAQNFLNNISQDPFFMAVGFHKPHIPLKFPREFLKYHPLEKVSKPIPMARPPSMPIVAWNTWTDVRHRQDIAALNISFPFGPMPESYTQLIRQSYYAAVTYIDSLIGKLLLTVKERNIHQNTTIVLIGDHGWSLGEHQEWAKYSNFDIAVRVPFLLHDPDHTTKLKRKKFANRVENTTFISNHLVELVDLAPTLCELTGIPIPPLCDPIPSSQKWCTEGESLVPILKHEENFKGKNGAFSQYPRPGATPSRKSDKPRLADITIMGYSVRTKRYRYTEWVKFKDLTPHWDKVYGVEMYDHQIDPYESLNIIGRPGLEYLQRQLQQQLRAGWRAARYDK